MKTLLLAMSILLLSGCGAILQSGENATLTGTPEGLRAILDGINGLVVTGKVSADQPNNNPYILMRQDQEEELTKRAMVPNFLSSIFARQSASNVTNIETK